MKIFFGCTAAELNKYQKHYLDIRNFIISEGHILTRDWLPSAIKRMNKVLPKDEYQPQQIAHAVQKALNDAELLIVEDTVSNFSTGYEITFALQRNKPVLVLWLKQKHHLFDRTLLHGIESEYLQISLYDSNNYQDIIRKFIKRYENIRERHRFNLVLNDDERKYLDWAGYFRHKSRTQIVRQALRKEIGKDKDYAKYLLKS